VLTQCPSCQTIFRITSEILRVAHGQVRCGRCHTQFDALQRLVEETEVEETSSGRYVKPEPQPDPEPEPIEVEEPAEQEDITLEGRHSEITGTYRVMDDPDDLQVRQEVTEEWVELDEVDDLDEERVSDSGIEVSEHVEAEDFYESAAEAGEGFGDAQEVAESEQERFARRLADQQERSHEAAESESELQQIAGVRASSHTELIWKILGAPLLLLLLVQVVHHYRSDLARSPGLGAAVTTVYGALGMKLTPDWQLHAYEIKQWGVLSDPAQPGTLKVRASVTNRARYAQPYPLLKLVLEDRWGDQVRAREFEPREYLDPGTAADRLLAPDQPANATINIVDPGPDAEGFRFDVCLRGKAKAPICAAEVPQ